MWSHLPASPEKTIIPYYLLVAKLITIGRENGRRYFGKEPDIIIQPYTKTEINWLLQTTDQWLLACASFLGHIDNHYPSNKLLHFLRLHPFIFPKNTSQKPLPNALTVFTDGSSTGIAAFTVNNQTQAIQTPYKSAQIVELFAVLSVMQKFSNDPINIYTDSAYIAQSLPLLETTAFIKPTSTAIHLFLRVQKAIRARSYPFFIGHLRAHTGLPGPLSTGNLLSDIATHKTTVSFVSTVDQAQQAHSIHHLNAQTLRLMFKITREQARQIVKQCPACVTHLPTPHLGVNPRGLVPNEIWQMDITHVPEFGKLKYLHVTVDTFSGFIFASTQTGEASKHVISHVLTCLSVMGKPKTIKTDNGPGYTGKNFQSFCSTLQIRHITGLPYNPQGQGIVERAHQTLKITINKLKSGELYTIKNSPKNVVAHALFILNFLQLDHNSKTAADRLWHPTTADNFASVLWRDPITNRWSGPDPVLIWGRGSVCIFDNKTQAARWLPERLTKQIDVNPHSRDGPAP